MDDLVLLGCGGTRTWGRGWWAGAAPLQQQLRRRPCALGVVDGRPRRDGAVLVLQALRGLEDFEAATLTWGCRWTSVQWVMEPRCDPFSSLRLRRPRGHGGRGRHIHGPLLGLVLVQVHGLRQDELALSVLVVLRVWGLGVVVVGQRGRVNRGYGEVSPASHGKGQPLIAMIGVLQAGLGGRGRGQASLLDAQAQSLAGALLLEVLLRHAVPGVRHEGRQAPWVSPGRQRGAPGVICNAHRRRLSPLLPQDGLNGGRLLASRRRPPEGVGEGMLQASDFSMVT